MLPRFRKLLSTDARRSVANVEDQEAAAADTHAALVLLLKFRGEWFQTAVADAHAALLLFKKLLPRVTHAVVLLPLECSRDA